MKKLIFIITVLFLIPAISFSQTTNKKIANMIRNSIYKNDVVVKDEYNKEANAYVIKAEQDYTSASIFRQKVQLFIQQNDNFSTIKSWQKEPTTNDSYLISTQLKYSENGEEFPQTIFITYFKTGENKSGSGIAVLEMN